MGQYTAYDSWSSPSRSVRGVRKHIQGALKGFNRLRAVDIKIVILTTQSPSFLLCTIFTLVLCHRCEENTSTLAYLIDQSKVVGENDVEMPFAGPS